MQPKIGAGRGAAMSGGMRYVAAVQVPSSGHIIFSEGHCQFREAPGCCVRLGLNLVVAQTTPRAEHWGGARVRGGNEKGADRIATISEIERVGAYP